MAALEDGCFAGCGELTDAVVPASVTQMGEGVFRACPLLTLRAQEGSAAWDYALESEIPCKQDH